MHNIFVIRFSSLGDVVLTTPVYRNIKTQWKDCSITVGVKAQYAGILEGNPSIDRLLILEEGETLSSYIGRVREKNFDILIDLHNNLRSNIIAFFSGIPIKIRYRKAIQERILFVKRKIKNPELERHTIDRYTETLGALGIKPQSFSPEIFEQDSSGPAENNPQRRLRFLIVQTAFLGDAVLTTPMFEAIRSAIPLSSISVLCTPETQEIFSGSKAVDDVLVMDKRKNERGLLSIYKWGKKLRNRFDIAILPHRSFRSAFLVWLAQIPKRIGFNNSQGRMFLSDTVRFDWKTHDAERNLKLLSALGILSTKPEIPLPYRNAHFDFNGFCASNGIPGNAVLVGMNPGSVWNTKRWLPERFAEVADKLIEENKCTVLIFGGKNDMDAVLSVVRSMKQKALNLCGKTDLKSLALLISHCSLFVTNDSGPMHLASAAGIPIVAIFGPTTKELGFFPYGGHSVVVEMNLPCRPCTLHGGKKCPLKHFKCMKEIGSDRVLEPCRKFLAARQGAHQ